MYENKIVPVEITIKNYPENVRTQSKKIIPNVIRYNTKSSVYAVLLNRFKVAV